MPIYEYVCRACGQEVERLQKLSDAPLIDCPDCGRPDLVRKMSAPSFRLKGGGWYETDFKGDKEKKRNLAGDADPTDSKPDKTPETKPDAKPENKPEIKAVQKTEQKAAPKTETKKPADSKPAAAPSGQKTSPKTGNTSGT